MTPDQLLIAATLAALIWSIAALARLFGRRTWGAGVEFLAAALMLAATIVVADYLGPGRNAVLRVIEPLIERRPVETAAFLLGSALGVVLALAGWVRAPQGSGAERGRWLMALASSSLVLLLALAFAAREPIKQAWHTQGWAALWGRSPGWVASPNFVVEEYCTLDFQPIQIAVGPDGDLYACYAGGKGGVARIHREDDGSVTVREIATHLHRPHGIAFHEGDLYVSRAGRYARAVEGRMVETPTGAVTRLRDLDGDGIMDFYEDVVSDLPGAQGPDPVHQNNGLAIAPDGAIYITVGSHADRAPATGHHEGTILRVPAPHAKPEVFARGFRNPFDIALGPGGAVFATDNDIGFEENDELNHVIDGEHYGHPYSDERQPVPEGTVGPIWTCSEASLQGLCYCDENAPRELHGEMLVVGFGPGEIHRLHLKPVGRTFAAQPELFARIPQALDVACDEDAIYVSAHADRTIYRIRHVENNE